MEDPNLIVGMERADDAGVYKLSEDLAIIQTVDFFTPIVDDPYMFGQIAAANALSDVYAMGGKPLIAMNIVCFPIKTMDISVLREILKGGLEKMKEAGVTLVGGHSIEDSELKYGLSVTGTIHPSQVLTNVGAQAGDRLILTKPLGTGIINTAIKAGMAKEESIERVSNYMARLNNTASEVTQEIGARACTDVSGFGLLGHAFEMIQGTGKGMIIHASSVPLFPEALDFAQMGLVPGGTYRNRDFRIHQLDIDPDASPYLLDILFDPQTSGGLLIAVPRKKAEKMVKRLKERGINEAAIIGEVVNDPREKIAVKLEKREQK
jgi:selenide,water dikinase